MLLVFLSRDLDSIKEEDTSQEPSGITENSMLNDLLQERYFKASSIEETSIQLKKEDETSDISNVASSDNLDGETTKK